MNFIKKIFYDEVDENVHLQFQKFSKGEFRYRALIKAKSSNGKYIINTSSEFANELVRNVAGKLGDEKTQVKGVVVSTSNLSGELDFQNKKQFMGVKKYVIDKEMSKEEIINLLDKFPKAFFGFSFKTNNSELKIKPKAPKSLKPNSGDEKKPKANFCKLKTTDAELGKSFVFEKSDFKNAEISHTFFITDLIMREGVDDFAKIRELAKRKGKIVREAEIDGQIIKSEREFVA